MTPNCGAFLDAKTDEPTLWKDISASYLNREVRIKKNRTGPLIIVIRRWERCARQNVLDIVLRKLFAGSQGKFALETVLAITITDRAYKPRNARRFETTLVIVFLCFNEMLEAG